jgi:hypothetical protein
VAEVHWVDGEARWSEALAEAPVEVRKLEALVEEHWEVEEEEH